MLPVVAEDPMAPSALPTPDSWKFFSEWEKKSGWKNTVTLYVSCKLESEETTFLAPGYTRDMFILTE